MARVESTAFTSCAEERKGRDGSPIPIEHGRLRRGPTCSLVRSRASALKTHSTTARAGERTSQRGAGRGHGAALPRTLGSHDLLFRLLVPAELLQE